MKQRTCRIVLSCAVLALCALSRETAVAQPTLTETQRVVSGEPPAPSREWFGQALAASGDTLVVGESLDGVLPIYGAGAAFVYVRSVSGAWELQQKLTADVRVVTARFGTSVAIDADTIVVGAPFERVGSLLVGAVYVFVRSGGTWTLQQRLAGSVANSSFGNAVGISGDRAVIGSRAFVDFYDRAGITWSQAHRHNTYYSRSVGICGTTAVIGLRNFGAAVFEHDGGTWTFRQNLTPSVTSGDYGIRVAIDGDVIAVGAPRHRAIRQHPTYLYELGGVFVFTRQGTTWQQRAVLVAPDGYPSARFGSAVALLGDSLLVGAPWQPRQGQSTRGAAYRFEGGGSAWSVRAKLVPTDALNHQFGIAVAATRRGAVVGTTYADVVYDFAQPTNTAAGARDLVLLDALGGPELEIATADAAGDSVTVYTVDPLGSLSSATTTMLPPGDLGAVAIAAGDLDGDGRTADVAVACADSHTVVLAIDPAGPQPTFTSLPCGGLDPVDIGCGDYDADPRADVVVARLGSPWKGGEGLALSLNGGAFVDVTIPVGRARRVARLAVADLDGDGDDDLAAIAQGTPDQILLFVGDGLGGLVFSDSIDLPTDNLAQGLCVVDHDADGAADLVVALPRLFPTPATHVQVFRNTGLEPFSATRYQGGPLVPTGGTFGVDIHGGELDGESIEGWIQGRPELVVVHAGAGGTRYVRNYGSSDRGASQVVDELGAGTNPIALAVGDMNGDGIDDIVVANRDVSDGGGLTIRVSRPSPLAQTYGTGCSGFAGKTPSIKAYSTPRLGNSGFRVVLVGGRPSSLATLSIGPAPDNVPFVGTTCGTYLVPATTQITSTSVYGSATFLRPIANDPSLLGMDVYFQATVADPSGAVGGMFAVSNALRIKIGY